MISEKEYNAQVKKAEMRTPEEKDECKKNWEKFQTVFRKCKYYYRQYWDFEMKMPENLRIGHASCKAGSMTGSCAFVGCPKEPEVLAMADEAIGGKVK